MDEKAAFRRAIRENLYDDAPRLVYADRFQEHGEDGRAEFIRVQCVLEPMRDRYETERAAESHESTPPLPWCYAIVRTVAIKPVGFHPSGTRIDRNFRTARR